MIKNKKAPEIVLILAAVTIAICFIITSKSIFQDTADEYEDIECPVFTTTIIPVTTVTTSTSANCHIRLS